MLQKIAILLPWIVGILAFMLIMAIVVGKSMSPRSNQGDWLDKLISKAKELWIQDFDEYNREQFDKIEQDDATESDGL